jgi:hypothetical protein
MVKGFDLQNLFKLRLDGSIPDSIKVRNCRFEGLSEEQRKFEVAVSTSVFHRGDACVRGTDER